MLKLKTVRRATTAFAVLSVLLGLPDASQVYAQEADFAYERMWPTLPQPWFFKRPSGVAASGDGSFYVADSFNFRLHKFTFDGQLLSVFNDGIGFQETPVHMDTDSDGNLYVAVSDRILKYDSRTNLVLEIETRLGGDGAVLEPVAVTVADDGTLFVLRQEFFLVQRYAADGTFETEWGDTGEQEAPVPIGWNPGIAMGPDGSIYAVDLGGISDGNNSANFSKDMVKRFNREGQLLDSWGRLGDSPGSFDVAQGIAVDEEGFVYVSDVFNGVVQKFTSAGNFVLRWPETDDLSRRIPGPEGIDVDDQGNVYVAVASADLIQKFTGDGVFINQWASSGLFVFPGAVDVDALGDVYVADTENNQVKVFDNEGRLLRRWGEPVESGGEVGFLAQPQGIVVDESFVYVADTGYNRIQKFTKAGAFVALWGSDDNNLPVGDADTDTAQPRGLAIDSLGRIHVVETDNSRVHIFTADGEHVGFLGEPGTGPGQFSFPTDIAMGPAGDVFVSDTFNARVQAFNADGDFVTEWGRFGEGAPTAGDPEFPIEFNEPAGIDVDAAGLVYVADFQNDRIQVFTSGGGFVDVIGRRGDEPGQFSRPVGLAAADDGRLYVADTGHNRVQVFAPEANVKQVADAPHRAIIVAGGGSIEGNDLWPTTQMVANFAYRALTHQGFAPEAIDYLTADTDLDLDNNPNTVDVTGDATAANLQSVLSTLSAQPPSGNVILYLTGSVGNGEFRIGRDEGISGETLGGWLDEFQAAFAGTLIVIMDTDDAGSFLPALASGSNRVLIGSTSSDEAAIFETGGTLSFSYFFWLGIFNGLDLHAAYLNATDAVGGVAGYQNPVLDDNGNGVANEPSDGQLAATTEGVHQVGLFNEPPSITSLSADQSLDIEDSSATFVAMDLQDEDAAIARVWTVVDPPEGTRAAAQAQRPTFDLIPDAANRFEATFDAFDAPGEYQVNVYALDGDLNVSDVRQTTVLKGLIPLSIVGLVSDEQGPIEGATVALIDSGIPTLSTNSDGIYAYTAVAEGDYMVEASASGFRSQRKPVSAAEATGAAINFLLLSSGSEGEGEGGCASSGFGRFSPAARLGDALLLLITAGALVELGKQRIGGRH